MVISNCKMCGRVNLIEVVPIAGGFIVGCGGCWMSGPLGKTVAEAVIDWNYIQKCIQQKG